MRERRTHLVDDGCRPPERKYGGDYGGDYFFSVDDYLDPKGSTLCGQGSDVVEHIGEVTCRKCVDLHSKKRLGEYCVGIRCCDDTLYLAKKDEVSRRVLSQMLSSGEISVTPIN